MARGRQTAPYLHHAFGILVEAGERGDIPAGIRRRPIHPAPQTSQRATEIASSTAVFASRHGNLAGSGAVPSVATIGSARQALRTMKSISDNFINMPRAIMLYGPVVVE